MFGTTKGRLNGKSDVHSSGIGVVVFFKSYFFKKVRLTPLTPLRKIWDNKGLSEREGRYSFLRGALFLILAFLPR
jgi:hypothetical protein